ncbi:MAG: alpha-amylase family glycosyl hydrolase [Bacteroidales bacterium]|nr:alpha-amylase family glycosyl hydrolase [Bacteroidales bacterium]
MTEKITIYQVLPRLYGNTTANNIPGGDIHENGCGKLGDFTPEVLKRIKDFGFTHIWYTGVLEHATQTDYTAYGIAKDHSAVVKGKAGSPYAIKDYYDICPDLAAAPEKRMKEFEALVRRTHKAGLKMLIDFVPNHVARSYHSDAKPARVKDLGEGDDMAKGFSPQNNFYYLPGQMFSTENFEEDRAANVPYREYPAKVTGNNCFSPRPGRNDWYETVKLNYGVDFYAGGTTHFDPVPDTWDKMTAILLFWAKKGVDGFRCDMAEMVPAEFWAYAIAKVKEKYPKLIFVAEVYNPAEYRRYLQSGFDYLYDKVGLYDTLRAVVRGEASASCITGQWQCVDDIRTHMLYFLENHDEQRIASDFFAGSGEKARPALAVSAFMGTNPLMIYAGQELGERGMDAEGFSGRDGRTTIFDYWHVDTLDRLCHGDLLTCTPEQQALYAYYNNIVKLCNSEAALREGTFYDLQYANYVADNGYNADRQYAFLRAAGKEKMLIVANFADQDVHVGVRIPENAFAFMGLREGMCSAHDLLSGEMQTLELRKDGTAFVEIPANNAVVLKF